MRSGDVGCGIMVGEGTCPQRLAAMTQFGLFWGVGLDRETTTHEIGIMQEVTREVAAAHASVGVASPHSVRGALKRKTCMRANDCGRPRTLAHDEGEVLNSENRVSGIRSSIPLSQFPISAQANRSQKLKRTQAVEATRSAAFRHELTPGRLEKGTTVWHARDSECRRSATCSRQTPPGTTPPGGETHGAIDDSRAVALHHPRGNVAARVRTIHAVRPDRPRRACQGAPGRISEGAGGIGARTGGAQGGRGNGGAVAASCSSRNGAPARNALMPTGDSARLCRSSPRDRRCAR